MLSVEGHHCLCVSERHLLACKRYTRVREEYIRLLANWRSGFGMLTDGTASTGSVATQLLSTAATIAVAAGIARAYNEYGAASQHAQRLAEIRHIDGVLGPNS